jgi:hypothetical protein
MKIKKSLEKPLGLAAIVGVVFYFVVSAILKLACDNGYPIDPSIAISGTSFLVALASSLTALIIVYAVDSPGSSDNFEKLAAIFAAGVTIVWLAYVFVDDRICSSMAWREYVTTLITPMLLISLAVIGRRWMKTNND